MTLLLSYFVIGTVAGLLAGLFGVGGGLVIVPFLTFLFSQQGFDAEIIVHLAVGTSLATIVFTSISSVTAHHRHAAVLWPVVFRLTPGILLGAGLGALLAEAMPTLLLRRFFALFELFVAIQMFMSLRPEAHRALPGGFIMSIAGVVIGTLSSIVGIGGGTLTVPFLVWCRVKMQQAVGTSSACGLPIAVGGGIGFIATGWSHADLPDWSSGFVYWPAWLGIVCASVVFAPVGAWLAHRLPAQRLKKIFAGFLFLLAVLMFSGA